MKKLLLLLVLLLCGCKGDSVFGTWELRYTDNFKTFYTIETKKTEDILGTKIEIIVIEKNYFFKELRSTKEHRAVFIEKDRLRLVSDSLFIYNISSDTISIRKDDDMDKDYTAIRIK